MTKPIVNVNVGGPQKPSCTYKTKVLKGNLPFAAQVSDEDTKYVIKFDFDLGGGSVTIPEGCLLEFDGGSISNGTVVGQETILIYHQAFADILHDVTTEGTFVWDKITTDDESIIEDDGVLQVNTNGILAKHIKAGEVTGAKLNADVVDDSSLEISGNKIKAKAGGIQGQHLNANVADNSSLVLSGNTLGVKAGGIQGSMLNSNVVDDEDVHLTADNKIQLKDKAYAPASFSGLGRKYLRKNIVSNKNVLTQAMMPIDTGQNTIYVIQYDYDLNGATVTVPAGCTLEFDGGSIKNGTLVGVNTKIHYEGTIFYDVSISGTWLVPHICSTMFSDIFTNNALKKLFALCSDSIHNTVEIRPGEYSVSISANKEAVFNITTSDTDIYLFGDIKLATTEFGWYTIFYIDANNVSISGSGSIEGDSVSHVYPSGQTHEMGTGIRCQKKNIHIDGIEIYHCIGDAIGVSADNVIIENVLLHDCGRDGVTLFKSRNTAIKNFEIYGMTRTADWAGIASEPEAGDTVCAHVTNGYIHDCHCGIYTYKVQSISHLFFENVIIENNIVSISLYKTANVVLKNLKVSNENSDTTAMKVQNCENVEVSSCVITGGVGGYCLNNNSANTNMHFSDCVITNRGTSYLSYAQYYNCSFVGGTQYSQAEYTKDSPMILSGCSFIDGGDSGLIVSVNPTFVKDCYFKNYKCTYICKGGIIEGCTFFSDIDIVEVDGVEEDKRLEEFIRVQTSNTYDGLTVRNNKFYCEKIKSQVVRFIGSYGRLENNVTYDCTVPLSTSNISVKPTMAYGSTSERPKRMFVSETGFGFFDTTINKAIFAKSIGETVDWIEPDGATAGVKRSGTFANKPAATDIYVGFKYFCTNKQTTEGATDGIEIIHKGSDVWVDALGRVVS